MKLAHKFDWHYAPMIGPIQPDGTYVRWCKWCGMRDTYTKERYELDSKTIHP